MFYLAEVDWNGILSSGNLPIIAVFGTATIVTVAIAFFGFKYLTHKSRDETLLKRDLVAKGYSTDEIERIVAASPGKQK